ncbi:ATP-binding protein [Tsuneonella sp. SYSU-LHT278]|uniref:PAS domain-containing sensor histidine kinase n=1 Tax=Tsuneonella sediminis TaxID=3416089 RepID=UPI003F78FCAD
MTPCAVPIDLAVAAGWLAAIDRSQFVVELEPDGTIVRANARLCAALGYEGEELVGRPHRELIVPGPRANASAGEPHRTIAYRARDGGCVIVRASATPIVGDDDRPMRLLVIGVDVSDRGDLRDALAFPSPWRDHPVGEHLAPSPSGGSAGCARFPAIAIADHVEACAEAMRPAAEDKNLVLRCAVDPDLPALAACDPVRLRQVLLHLIGNAVRSTDQGWISVCAEPAWDDPGTLAISVTDTGSGVDAGGIDAGAPASPHAPRKRCENPRWLLAEIADTARQMDGAVTLSSERGRGTRAELRVPLRPLGTPRAYRSGRFTLPD